MYPESSSITFRPELAVLAQEYLVGSAASKFIGLRTAPIFNAGLQSGEYPILNREYFKKPAETRRAAPGAPYNTINAKLGQGTYSCVDYGLTHPIDDRQVAIYSRLFNLEVSAISVIMHQMLLTHEIRVAALYSGAGYSNTNVTTDWSTTATAVPLDDFATGINDVCDMCGAVPGDISLIIPRADYIELMRTAQFIAKGQYTYPGIIPAQMAPMQVAGLLGIKECLVAQSSYDSTEEGVAETNAQIWTAGVMYLAVCAPANSGLDTPSAARTIAWNEGEPDEPIVESWREEKNRSNYVRVRGDMDEVLTGETDLFAYQLTNT